MAQNGAQNGTRMGPKMSPKQSPFRGLKSSKTLCFRDVFAKNGAPKGPKKRAENGAENEPETSQNLGQKGAKRGVKGDRNLLKSLALRNRPKWGVRKFLEIFLKNFLVMNPQTRPRKSFRKSSSLVHQPMIPQPYIPFHI